MDSKSTIRTAGHTKSVISGGCQSPNKSLRLLRRDMKTFYDGLDKKKSAKIGFGNQDTKDILASSDEEEEDAGTQQQGSLKTIKIQFSISKNNSSSNLIKLRENSGS
jgi:hypothetical protein